MPSAKTYAQSAAPHIRDSETTAWIYWKQIVSLLPLVASAFYFSPFESFRVLGLSLVAGVASEWLFSLIFKKKLKTADGSSIYFLLLFAVLLPPGLPVWVLLLGGFLTVGIFKELPGGLGSYPIHPAAAALLIQQTFFPSALSLTSFTPSAIVSGIILLLFKLARFELLLFYLLGWVIPAQLLNLQGAWPFKLEHSLIWITAFFLVTDASLAPMKSSGRRIFAFSSGVLGVLLIVLTGSVKGILAALLIMETMTPWIDSWIQKPKVKV